MLLSCFQNTAAEYYNLTMGGPTSSGRRRKKRQVGNGGGATGNSPTDDAEELMKQNMLKFNVFFKTLSSQQVVESVKYDLTTTFYAIGGALSLFLGISLSMIFEVLEFLVDLVINLVKYAHKFRRSQRMTEGEI